MLQNCKKYLTVLFFGTFFGAAIVNSFWVPFVVGLGCLGIYYLIEKIQERKVK